MSALTDTLDRIEQMWIPGVERFYEKLNPDPWMKADEDVSVALADENWSTQRLALAGYEARKQRMLELYRQIRELQDKPLFDPSPFSRGFRESAEFLARDSVLCDCCKRPASQTKRITLWFETIQDEMGDPLKVIRATCESCARRVA